MAGNKVKSFVRKLRIEYEKSVSRSAKDNPKKYAKSKTKVKQGIPDLDIRGIINQDNPVATTKNDTEKADTLLEYFCSVFTT